MLAAKTEGVSSSLGTYIVEAENTLAHCPLTFILALWHVSVCGHTHKRKRERGRGSGGEHKKQKQRPKKKKKLARLASI